MAIADNKNDVSHDPILEQVASTNTFDSDWPTLRDHLHTALRSTLPLFLSVGPPRPYRPPFSPPALVAASSPIKPDDDDLPPHEAEAEEGDKPPSESLLLSPSHPISQLENTTPTTSTRPGNGNTMTPRSVDVEPTNSPSRSRLNSLHSDDLEPSTPGGLVIPPFPPLDRSRRRSRSASSSSSSSEAGPSSLGPSPRVNGANAQHLRGGGAMAVFEDDWDEDVAIGGKKLPAWMEEDEGKKELDRLAKTLEEMEVAPFTIQRLAELLLNPMQYHKTLGKFLRAVEKTLLVNSPWEPPSYTPSSIGALIGGRSFGGGSTSSTSSASSDNGSDYDSDSTMPPGASTPMFVPIPFIVHPDMDDQDQEDMDPLASHAHKGDGGNTLDDGLMSPLMFSGESTFGQSSSSTSTTNVRSPTPEPEDVEGDADADMDIEDGSSLSSSNQDKSSSPVKNIIHEGQSEKNRNSVSIEHSDPAHQSYLGRVDELDTGPITSPTTTSSSKSPSQSKTSSSHRHGNNNNGTEEIVTSGTGEGGNMTPHGMSDKPVPISSTTVLEEKEKDKRQIANLPKSTSEKSLHERFVSESNNDNDKEEK